MATNDPAYIHGFSEVEQQRLLIQAQVAKPLIFGEIDFSACQHVVEIGSGVGAQTEILLERFPKLQVSCVDNNDAQLRQADANLSRHRSFTDRYRLLNMDAKALPIEPGEFDGAFLCWVLEHIPQPLEVVEETRRVMRPGGVIYVNEVLNASFFMKPHLPNFRQYWNAFNEHQYEVGGDPDVAASIGNLLLRAGFRNIETSIKTFFFDQRTPEKCGAMIAFWHQLILSAAEPLIAAGKVTEQTVAAMEQEVMEAQQDPDATFFYSFIQARAVK